MLTQAHLCNIYEWQIKKKTKVEKIVHQFLDIQMFRQMFALISTINFKVNIDCYQNMSMMLIN
jgi:hypothetical protein